MVKSVRRTAKPVCERDPGIEADGTTGFGWPKPRCGTAVGAQTLSRWCEHLFSTVPATRAALQLKKKKPYNLNSNGRLSSYSKFPFCFEKYEVL